MMGMIKGYLMIQNYEQDITNNQLEIMFMHIQGVPWTD